MRTEKIMNDDVLRKFLKGTDIQKAPEGFSSKVMSHIYMEVKPVRPERNYLIPVVFGSVFALLTIAALFVPESSFNFPEIRLPENINFTFPELWSAVNIPHIFTYIVAGVIVIAVFDSGLKTLFRKVKN